MIINEAKNKISNKSCETIMSEDTKDNFISSLQEEGSDKGAYYQNSDLFNDNLQIFLK